ncbi:YdcF family protein [Corynebacterium suranareeae]
MQPVIRVVGYSLRSTRNDRHKIDSILVLGTAQYDGVPSRQFAARLRHTAKLWRLHEIQHVFTVGGKLPGDRFTEAEVAREYLVKEGVDPDLIFVSAKGNDTASSFKALDPQTVGRVLIVTDPNHSYRAIRIARSIGFDAQPSPTPYSPAKFPSKVYFLTLTHEWGGVVVQDVARLFGARAADMVEEMLRSIQGLLRPSRRARHEQLRRLKK